MSAFTTIIPLACLLAIVSIIGVYVYRDATQRCMNARLWTAIAVLFPTAGLIIYLLVRGDRPNLN
jgi:hypothetical protein